ncbi:strigolactones hydrolase CXE15-like [Typha angustifolia]|uniref:strigolactones hydrolase CXE15-like n=1 Tax=Typha angustifolia TaxID=59011 RepID=UPI003C2BD0DD
MSSSSISSSPSAPYVVEDCRGHLQLLSDGTVVRSPHPIFPVDVPNDFPVDWKDILFDPNHGLHLRLYMSRVAKNKLPVLVYFHGGGFCIGSRTWPNFHASCLRLASDLHVIVASFDYRLAPEHRLPAAFDDATTALLWLRDQSQSDAWLSEHADLSSVFVIGESAGGTIAHQMAVQFGRTGLNPVRLCGFVLVMPGFVAEERTKSELDCLEGAFLCLEQLDRYCRLSLPPGATRDHPFWNPFGPESPNLEAAELAPLLVVVAERDLLRDRGVEYATRLKEMGKEVELLEIKGQEHGFFAINPWSKPVGEMIRFIKLFMDEFGNKSDE